MKFFNYTIFLIAFCALLSCKENHSNSFFTLMESEETGLHFTNKVQPGPELNMLNYLYFYNGSGIGAGDFNKDGLVDLFFATNMGQNTLYLNKGGLEFSDVTRQANIPTNGYWSNGVAVADVNGDGLLDIYITVVGNMGPLKGKNQLLICKEIKNGIPVYEEMAEKYGLDYSSLGSQAAFFDFDLDGDLDLFLMNHSLRYDNTFNPRYFYENTYETNGHQFFRNDANKFTNITREAGINSSIIGYGLGLVISDIDLDGWPDIYVGNDFHENDYLYINQKNGSFKEELPKQINHTSQYTMGVDIADADNDALPEIIAVDMLPYDPTMLKRSVPEDNYNLFNYKLQLGYHPHYARNVLQWNRGNDLFSEMGQYAGVEATDWSWAPLWMDFDNDGWKDLFISNGIPRRLNDLDYVNFISNRTLQMKLQHKETFNSGMTLIETFPEIKLPNHFFLNKKKLSFQNINNQIGNAKSTFSQGAIYADLDNDGDLDIVVNNLFDPVMLYRNNTNSEKSQKSYLHVQLKGFPANTHSLGAKIFLYFNNGDVRYYEKYPTRGYMSSMEIPVHIGLSSGLPDSALIVWPNNTYDKIDSLTPNRQITIAYKPGLPPFDYNNIKNRNQSRTLQFEEIKTEIQEIEPHRENKFEEFDREPLIPAMLSRQGPCLAVADINGDQLDDIFVGSAHRYKSNIYLQKPNGSFTKTAQPELDIDSLFEETDAQWVDVNADGHVDLVVASGGNELLNVNGATQPRVYLNNGKGKLTRLTNAFPDLQVTPSCLAPADFNADGFVDFFIGGRCVPGKYGEVPESFLFLNDGHGRFKSVTQKYSPKLSHAGMVTDAAWCDLNNDHLPDLTVALEWGGIISFINQKNSFRQDTLTDKHGRWNCLQPVDINKDGFIDLVAGNLGTNTRFRASDEEPLKMYYADFDNNGTKETILTYYSQHSEITVANKVELEKTMPFLKKKFLYAKDFAQSSVSEIFGKEKLQSAEIFTANFLENVVLLNDGKMNFKLMPLPWQAQLTVYKAIVPFNANNDVYPDLLMGGNMYEQNIQMGRMDADYGTVLINKGNGTFQYEANHNLHISGQVRTIQKIKLQGKEEVFVAGLNNDFIKWLKPHRLQTNIQSNK